MSQEEGRDRGVVKCRSQARPVKVSAKIKVGGPERIKRGASRFGRRGYVSGV